MWEIVRVIGLCHEESSPCPTQIGVIIDGQTHEEQFFTVPLLRLRFQRLIVHTYYSLLLELLFASQGAYITHTYARGANRLNGLTESIYREAALVGAGD